jgi:uroporphyrinogen-III decarboxylase
MNGDNEKLYQERLDLIKKAIHVEPVARIPVIYMGDAFSPRYMGMKLSQYVSDPEAPVDVTVAAMDRIGGFDGINLAGVGRRSSGFGLGSMKMPGRELPEDSVWQVEEIEIMKPEDYDTIIEKGYPVFLSEALPRAIKDMEAFQANMAWLVANAGRKLQDYRNHGYVIISGFGMGVPLELFAGARSTPQFFYDLYRRPDKVKAAMDAAMPTLIQQTIMITKMSPVLGSWIGGFRGAPPFLSPKLWDKFFFPYLLQMVEALVENDIVPILHFDQCWDRELSRLRELPAKKCVLNPDGMTDLRKFKEVVGDHMSVMGDVPSTLFAIGTPEEIRNYVRDLVRDIGPQGLLLAPGCDAPVNTKPENMKAFVAAAHEFGKV